MEKREENLSQSWYYRNFVLRKRLKVATDSFYCAAEEKSEERGKEEVQMAIEDEGVKLPIKVAPYQNKLSHFCSIYFGHVLTETLLLPDPL